MLMYWDESAQTLQVRVLQSIPKAIIHNKCGLLMCVMTGLKPRTVA